jgi:hypothetical protein
VVSDGELSSLPDEVQVIVNAVNQVPTADAGEDQTVYVNGTVILDGSSSTDSDGDPLEYFWSQLEGPENILFSEASSSQSRLSFEVTETGTYNFQLVVSDGTDLSSPDYVKLTVLDDNQPPVAVVVDVGSVEVGGRVSLDGSGSYDPDGDPLTYVWTQIVGPQITLENPDAPVVGFYTVTEGILAFQLVVHDGELPSNAATVEITVNGSNQVPIAEAGRNLKARVDDHVCLDGSASYDPDPEDSLSFSWSQTGGSKSTLYGYDTPTPCFTPRKPGKYAFDLIVSDGDLHSMSDKVDVHVKK